MHKVFIDLEDTIIDEFGVNNFLRENAEKIRFFLKIHAVFDELHIFSFALLNTADEEKFKRELEKPLLEFFDLKKIIVHTKDKVMQTVCEARKIAALDEFTFSQIFGKDLAFELFIRYSVAVGEMEPETFHLFDDTVQNSTIIAVPNKNTEGMFKIVLHKV